MIIGSSWDGFGTMCLLFVDFVFTFPGHVWGHFVNMCGIIVLEQVEISKSNEQIPDKFSIKHKASHEVERQIQICFLRICWKSVA